MKKFETLELDVSKLRTGDLVLMRYGYMPNAIAIRGFINMKQTPDKRCPFNHVALVVMVHGKPYIFEAVGGGTDKPTSALTRLDCKKIAVRRPEFGFRSEFFEKIATEYSARGTKYDYKGTFVEQAIFQSLGLFATKSEEEGDEKLYCSEYYARVINRLIPEMYNGENGEIPYYMVDPQDLYIDDRYKTIFEGKAITK